MQGSYTSSTSHLHAESRWSSVWRMLSIVILLWILAQFVLLIAVGFVELDGAIIIAGSLCSFPLVALLLYIRRPKLEHLIIAEPTTQGQYIHSLPTQRFCKRPYLRPFVNSLCVHVILSVYQNQNNSGCFFWAVSSFHQSPLHPSYLIQETSCSFS